MIQIVLFLFYLFNSGKDGARPAAKISVFVPPDHELRVPGKRPCCQPVATLHLTSVADQ